MKKCYSLAKWGGGLERFGLRAFGESGCVSRSETKRESDNVEEEMEIEIESHMSSKTQRKTVTQCETTM